MATLHHVLVYPEKLVHLHTADLSAQLVLNARYNKLVFLISAVIHVLVLADKTLVAK